MSTQQLESNPATVNFGLSQIGQIAVPVSDIERAIAFYRDTLGMRFLFQAPPGLGFFDCAGVRLMLDAPAKAQAENYSSIIYYKVPELHAAFEALSASAEVHVSAQLVTAMCMTVGSTNLVSRMNLNGDCLNASEIQDPTVDWAAR